MLRQTLLLLHPFIPFITEELWSLLGCGTPGKFIEDAHLENASVLADAIRKTGVKLDRIAAENVERLKKDASQIRAFKSEQGEGANKNVELVVVATDAQWDLLEQNLSKMQRMVGAASLTRGKLTVPSSPMSMPHCLDRFPPCSTMSFIKISRMHESDFMGKYKALNFRAIPVLECP